MLRLLTLGCGAVVNESGDGTEPAATQRRTVGLLSVLAVAGPSGVSRDRLVALFWPETDVERGRHALTQALYASRRALRCDDLFVIDRAISLHADRITSDVGDFEKLLPENPEAAVRLYAGPFLDGFFLPGAAEFDRWSAAQRARIEGRALRALQDLATTAVDPRRALQWWKRAAALRPLDGEIAVRLMTALAESGDRAGALKHAEIHAALVREELEADPDRSITELVRSLRDPPPHSGRLGIAADVVVAHPMEGDSRVRIGSQPSTRHPRSASRGRPRFGWLTAVAAVLVAVITSTITRSYLRATNVDPPPLRQRIVVAPFRVAGADPSLAYLREGVVELLSARLANEAQSIDAGEVLGAWRSAGISPAMDVPRNTVVELANGLRAQRVVVGGVVGSPRHIVIRATLLRVPDATVASQAIVEGPSDSIASLVARLAARLLVAEAGEEGHIGSGIRAPLPALREYLAGQAAFHQGDYVRAIGRYEASLHLDSTFALAALHLATAADRVGDVDRERRGLRIAWSGWRDLAERDRAAFRALGGPSFPAPSDLTAQVNAWRRPADLEPSNPTAWLTLASRLIHDGAIVGVGGSEAMAETALRRALANDTSDASAATLLAQLEAMRGDTGVLSTSIRRMALADSANPLSMFLRWRFDAARHDSEATRILVDAPAGLSATSYRAVALSSQFDAVALSDGRRALDLLHTIPASAPAQLDLALAEHSLALNQGRIRDAVLAAEKIRTIAGSHVVWRLRVLDNLYGDGDAAAANAAAEKIEADLRAPANSAENMTAGTIADLCVVGQWMLRADDLLKASQFAQQLRRAPAPGASVPIGADATACAGFIETGAAIAAGSHDGESRLAHLDSLALTPQVAGDFAVYAPLWLARLHARTGDTLAALRAIRRRPYLSDWPRYLTTALREEGRLSAAAGDLAGARSAYDRYLIFRSEPDPSLRTARDSVLRARAHASLTGSL